MEAAVAANVLPDVRAANSRHPTQRQDSKRVQDFVLAAHELVGQQVPNTAPGTARPTSGCTRTDHRRD
jgi:hypothetical protein